MVRIMAVMRVSVPNYEILGLGKPLKRHGFSPLRGSWLGTRCDNGPEFLRIQAGSPDQGTIDVA